MAKTFIVGNWKMNFTVGESSLYLHKIQEKLHPSRDLQVIVAPSTVALQPLSLQVDRHKLKLAAQNFCSRDYGSYTGETSISQLRSLVDYAIVGHSERRHIFHETDKEIREKVATAVRAGVTPILCIGETDSERSFGETADVLRDQLLGGLSEISAEDLDKVIIAYHPVWAISSTGNTRLASPDDVAIVSELIRHTLKSTFGKAATADIPLLYGGSVNAANAAAYLSLPEINGLLLGRSSLITSEFLAIIETAKGIKNE